VTDWQTITQRSIDRVRRTWAAQRWLVQQANDEFGDAEALLEELDASWDQAESMNERIRHQLHRLHHKRHGRSLDLGDRDRLIAGLPDTDG